MISKRDAQELASSIGAVFGPSNESIGAISAIYTSAGDGEARWVSVNTGQGHKGAFVPLLEATKHNADIHVPYTQAKVLAAPLITRDGHLDAEEEHQLYQHYSLNHASGTAHRILPPEPNRTS